jgi:hypothetical protein
MLSSPTYNIPRELISYILSIKSFQAWKVRLRELHLNIVHAIVPQEIEDDGDDITPVYHFRYGNSKPICENYSEKYVTITYDLGHESEDDEDGNHFNHTKTEVFISCHKGSTYSHFTTWSDYDFSGNESEEDCDSDWHMDEEWRFTDSISFSIPLWRKRHGHWRLY